MVGLTYSNWQRIHCPGGQAIAVFGKTFHQAFFTRAKSLKLLSAASSSRFQQFGCRPGLWLHYAYAVGLNILRIQRHYVIKAPALLYNHRPINAHTLSSYQRITKTRSTSLYHEPRTRQPHFDYPSLGSFSVEKAPMKSLNNLWKYRQHETLHFR